MEYSCQRGRALLFAVLHAEEESGSSIVVIEDPCASCPVGVVKLS